MQSTQQPTGYPQQYYPPPAPGSPPPTVSQAPSNQQQPVVQSYWQPPLQPSSRPQQRRRSRLGSLQLNSTPRCIQFVNVGLGSFLMIYGFVTSVIGIVLLASVKCPPDQPRNSYNGSYYPYKRQGGYGPGNGNVVKLCEYPYDTQSKKTQSAEFFYLSPISGHARYNQLLSQAFDVLTLRTTTLDPVTVGSVLSMFFVPLLLDFVAGIFMIAAALKPQELVTLFSSIFLATGTVLEVVSIYIAVQLSRNPEAFLFSCPSCIKTEQDFHAGMASLLHLFMAGVRSVGIYASLTLMAQVTKGGNFQTGARRSMMMGDRRLSANVMSGRPSVMMGSMASPYYGTPRGSFPSTGMDQGGSAASPENESPRGSVPSNNTERSSGSST